MPKHPDAAVLAAKLNGVQLIAAERQRQISDLGYDAAHDDAHCDREIARAALAYLDHYVGRSWVFTNELAMPGVLNGPKQYRDERCHEDWPWDSNYWNPNTPLQDLIKVGALVAAEIDRLQRAANKEAA